MFATTKWIDLSAFLLACYEAGIEPKPVAILRPVNGEVSGITYNLNGVECTFYRQQNCTYAAADTHPETKAIFAVIKNML